MKKIDKLIAIASGGNCIWVCSKCPLRQECDDVYMWKIRSNADLQYKAMQIVIKMYKKGKV